MSAFRRRVAELTGVAENELRRLAGGDLSEVLLVQRPDGQASVAKGGTAIAAEATMLRALGAAGAPVPAVEAEHEGMMLLSCVRHDGLFSGRAWTDIGAVLARIHATHGDSYGWPVDHVLGTVQLDNRQGTDWPAFWGEQRLVATASLLDRPWRERVERLAARIAELLPADAPPSLLHGDLWTGNILVEAGRVAALIDPACYHGDAEVDLAMLTLFDTPPEDFWAAYGSLAPGWEPRRAIYQLFPALVHMRLFGAGYAQMTDRLLASVGF